MAEGVAADAGSGVVVLIATAEALSGRAISMAAAPPTATSRDWCAVPSVGAEPSSSGPAGQPPSITCHGPRPPSAATMRIRGVPEVHLTPTLSIGNPGCTIPLPVTACARVWYRLNTLVVG